MKRERIVYLHVGMPKTGTTSIQFLINKYRKQLLENDMYIPKIIWHSFENYDNPQGLVVFQIFSNKSYIQWKYLFNLIDEINKVEQSKILISSEDFSFLYNQIYKLKKIRQIFNLNGYLVKIIISKRDIMKYLDSFYPTSISRGGSLYTTKMFVEYIINKNKIPMTYHGKHICFPVNFSEVIDQFKCAFGKNNVICLEYSYEIVNDFFDIFGIKIDEKMLHLFKNKSLDKNKILFLLYFNKLERKLHIKNNRFLWSLVFILGKLPNIGKFEFSKEEKAELEKCIEKANKKRSKVY